MNQIIIDCSVQKDTRLFEEIANFNVSAKTGEYTVPSTDPNTPNKTKNRFTYIRVVYPHEVTQQIVDLLQPGSMIRLYGKLDSEQYETKREKIVFNKVICADRIVRIRYDKTLHDYVEVDVDGNSQ